MAVETVTARVGGERPPVLAGPTAVCSVVRTPSVSAHCRQLVRACEPSGHVRGPRSGCTCAAGSRSTPGGGEERRAEKLPSTVSRVLATGWTVRLSGVVSPDARRLGRNPRMDLGAGVQEARRRPSGVPRYLRTLPLRVTPPLSPQPVGVPARSAGSPPARACSPARLRAAGKATFPAGRSR
jgi:hypothetical protein